MTVSSQLHSTATIPAQYTHLHGLDLLPLAKRQPLNLESDTQCGLSVYIPKGTDENYLDLLYLEIEHYARLLGKQHCIQQIWLLGEGVSNMDPSELTQLSYRLAAQFRGAITDSVTYGIEISYQQLTQPFMALLRGLRFQQLRVRFEAPLAPSNSNWMEEIAENIDLLESGGFTDICCCVNLSDFPIWSELKKLLLGLQLYRPHQIELLGLEEKQTEDKESQHCSDQKTVYSQIMSFFSQRDYRTLGNHLFVAPNSAFYQLANAQKLAFRTWGFCDKNINSWIGMGLGASGHFGKNHYQNTPSLNDYLEKLDKNQLPYLRVGTLPEDQLGTQRLVQSLFCYGRIDGSDVEALPAPIRLPIERLITEATEQLWLEPAGYTWALTTSGFTHLRSLFQQLCHPRTLLQPELNQ